MKPRLENVLVLIRHGGDERIVPLYLIKVDTPFNFGLEEMAADCNDLVLQRLVDIPWRGDLTSAFVSQRPSFT